MGNAAGGVNRRVAISGDRLFTVTDHAHIVALNRSAGDLLWDTEMADWHQNYNATSAPLAVGDLIISGTAGGDEGARGFVAPFDQPTLLQTGPANSWGGVLATAGGIVLFCEDGGYSYGCRCADR